MFDNVICLKLKNIRHIQMVKTGKTKIKSIQNEEVIMSMTMTKTIITKTIIIVMMRMRIKLGNRIKI